MVTQAELVRAVLAPLIVSAVIAALGRWRSWAWSMPAAAGAGFLAGYSLLGVPGLPPRDGTDWLFWLSIPLTLLGVIDAVLRRRGGWLLGASAGPASLVLLWPLTPGSVSVAAWFVIAISLAGAAAALTFALQCAEDSIGPKAIAAGLCIALGGAAVVVLSSNLRIVGIYGLAAAAALLPVAAFARRADGERCAARSVAIVAVPLLAGLLVAGRWYPDPGVGWTPFTGLMFAPILLLVGSAVPDRRRRLRGFLGVLAVGIAVASLSVPAALAAKRAAESDPYSSV